jgi:hypothetical protein
MRQGWDGVVLHLGTLYVLLILVIVLIFAGEEEDRRKAGSFFHTCEE